MPRRSLGGAGQDGVDLGCDGDQCVRTHGGGTKPTDWTPMSCVPRSRTRLGSAQSCAAMSTDMKTLRTPSGLTSSSARREPSPRSISTYHRTGRCCLDDPARILQRRASDYLKHLLLA